MQFSFESLLCCRKQICGRVCSEIAHTRIHLNNVLSPSGVPQYFVYECDTHTTAMKTFIKRGTSSTGARSDLRVWTQTNASRKVM